MSSSQPVDKFNFNAPERQQNQIIANLLEHLSAFQSLLQLQQQQQQQSQTQQQHIAARQQHQTHGQFSHPLSPKKKWIYRHYGYGTRKGILVI